jgi:prepilin-type N-terminal cleavage/methylation domain-containing protein
MRSENRRAGFTLIEMIVGLTVFTMIITAASGWLIRLSRDWSVQRDYLVVSQEADAVMDVIAQDIRRALSITADSESDIQIRTAVSRGVRYTKDGSILVRSVSSVWPADASNWINPENITRHIVNTDIFDTSTANRVNVRLVVRPKPELGPEVQGNKDYTAQSTVQCRRQ